MSLYQIYRPSTLDEVWGNEDTVRTLRKLLSRPVGEIPHALLFSGPSGCGKTTLARIFANTLGCAPADFTEVDSADFRGIDHMRDIIRKSKLCPQAGPVRVWLLDECHKLSGDAQNALLKTLEDGAPPKCYFLLATTDPQLLVKTLVNRCTQFVVESLSVSVIRDLVLSVADAEGKPITKEMGNKIAVAAQGSSRAALVALDSVIDLDEAHKEAAIQAFQFKESQVIELCRALNDKKAWKVIGKILAGLQEDPEGTRRAVLGYFNKILVKDGAEHAAWVIENFQSPFYDSGLAGLSYACYRVLNP